MGSELVDEEMERKSNGVGDDKAGTLPKTEAKDYEERGCSVNNSVVRNHNQEPDVLGVKSTNFESNLTKYKNGKPQTQKSGDDKKFSVPSSKFGGPKNTRRQHTIPQPFALATEKRAAVNSCTIMNNLNPVIVTKNSQPNSPLMARKTTQHDGKKPADEEDNLSVASSTAASLRIKSVTIGTAPTFKSAERAERRKQFYTKLGEKHRALEEQRSQAEARSKEEQQAAIKQLRKNMVVKANPVPSFYYEPPPPKVEPKKMPLTRPVSPNLNRRKSCGDAVQTSLEEIGKHCARHRHSMDPHKEGSTTPASARTKLKNSPQTIRTR